jgi:hypothetical protein
MSTPLFLLDPGPPPEEKKGRANLAGDAAKHNEISSRGKILNFATPFNSRANPRREQLIEIVNDCTCSEDARQCAAHDFFLEFLDR